MKVLIAAGGTGGHVYPGIALAQELKKRGHEVMFVIRKGDKTDIISSYGWKYFQIELSGLPRKLSLKLILFFFKLFYSFVESTIILHEFSPQIVVGMGGYVSFPVSLMAKGLGYPVIMHEQNSYPGLANRMLNLVVNRVAISFPGTEKHFLRKNNVVFTGNPVREEIGKISRDTALNKFGLDKKKFTVLVFGGSAGAHKINEIIVETLKDIISYNEKMQFIHITGEKDFEPVKYAYASQLIRFMVYPYYNEMEHVYAAADLVISRSGATTVAELYSLQKKCILIPYPYATNNHQFYNAKYLAGLGLAEVVLEKELSVQRLKDILVKALEGNRGQVLTGEKTGHSSASERLTEIVLGFPSS